MREPHQEHTPDADPRWPAALALFNGEAWYEAHDAFEELWHETMGPDRPLLQGIVQIAVAHVHLERGNARGATVLLGEALGRLQGCEDGSLGLDLTRLRRTIADRLQLLQQGAEIAALTALPLPELRALHTGP